MGLIYIAAIYLAYFLIGLGLMQAILFTGEHHLMARIGSWLVIVLGLINVKDYSRVIPPGHRADLTVTFDADYHPARGNVTRLVWFATNDPTRPWVEVRVTADVQR